MRSHLWSCRQNPPSDSPDHGPIGHQRATKGNLLAMTATAVAVADDYAPPPPRQGIAALRARHALFASLRCAWLRAALDPVVRRASSSMIVPLAANGDKANNPLYRTFEVREIAGPSCHPFPSPSGKRRRSACEPHFRGARVVKNNGVTRIMGSQE